MPEIPRLSIRAAAKTFGATRAVVAADLTVSAGQVHTLLGENGSGKSTLVKILGGIYRPDAGELLLDGEPIVLRNPSQARRAGIAAVFQEVLTAGAQSVLDNVWLGSDGLFAVRGRTSERRAKAGQLLGELLGREVNLDVPAASLSLSDRQAVSIARALVAEPRVLILDESTAALDIATRDRLFACIRRLTAEGTSVLFISHRMDEITEISDVVTVLRSGSTVATLDRPAAVPSRLLELMTGAEPLVAAERRPPELGDVVLRADGVRLGEARPTVGFELRAGELVGLAGLEGHGQEQFLRRLAGLLEGEGDVLIEQEGREPEQMVARRADRLRVAYLPRERRGESLFNDLTIRENFGIPTLSSDSTAGWWSPARTSRRFEPYQAELRVRMRSDRDPISTLSGGNQQKVVMSRWLATDPRVLLLNDPTRGVDIGTKRELYTLLDRLCRSGLAVVMLSSEIDELIELMDRVVVFRDQTVSAELSRAELSRQKLAAAYFGQDGAAA